jgi:hypothetical protein
MGSMFKEEELRDMIKYENPIILLLHETKLEEAKMLKIDKKQRKN